jgi:peroxiredoxin
MSKSTSKEKKEIQQTEYKNFWQNPKIRGRIKTGIFFLVFLIFFIVNNTGNSTAEGPYPPHYKGKNQFTAPEFTVNTIDDKTISLSQFRGKVVILDFFSYRSHYVTSSVPTLVSLKEEFTSDKLEIIGISIDQNTSPANIKTYMDNYKLNYPVSIIDNDIARKYSMTYGGSRNIVNPATIIIDQSGNIYAKYVGQLKKETYFYELTNLIKKE